MGFFRFTPYALPALFTLLAKACIFFYARQSRVHNLNTSLFLLFLFCLAIQNIAELTFFSAKAEGMPSPPGGKLYFGASILAVAFFAHLSLATATNNGGREQHHPVLTVLLYAPALMLQALLWSGPLLVAGFVPQGYTYTKVPGNLYFLFELYTLAYLCMAVALFAYGAFTQRTSFARSQNKLLLAGLLPPVALVMLIVALQRFGFSSFNTTTTLPVAITFFLAVTAYATHQYRLFDIEFFIPWSKLRRRKTEFYKRIQATVGAISELGSVREIVQLIADTLRCQLALIGGPHPVTAQPAGQDANRQALPLSTFPHDQLKDIEQIVVAQEIADTNPPLYRAMETYRVGAIVPFRAHGRTATHWLMLGDHFSNEVYTPLDFQAVERLFAVMAERFLDDFLCARAELDRLKAQLTKTRHDLGLAWHREHEARKALSAVRARNRELMNEIARLGNPACSPEPPGWDETSARESETLTEYLKRCERQALLAVLRRYEGKRDEATAALGITRRTLEGLLERHRITADDLQRK